MLIALLVPWLQIEDIIFKNDTGVENRRLSMTSKSFLVVNSLKNDLGLVPPPLLAPESQNGPCLQIFREACSGRVKFRMLVCVNVRGKANRLIAE